jgi:hypothetical protein
MRADASHLSSTTIRECLRPRSPGPQLLATGTSARRFERHAEERQVTPAVHPLKYGADGRRVRAARSAACRHPWTTSKRSGFLDAEPIIPLSLLERQACCYTFSEPAAICQNMLLAVVSADVVSGKIQRSERRHLVPSPEGAAEFEPSRSRAAGLTESAVECGRGALQA